MASERQITANRRNARNSTGPHSGAGKKRGSRNAYRHGLTLSKASDGSCQNCVSRTGTSVVLLFGDIKRCSISLVE